jgi:omega-6 fatty acid desaturase (delta-12 desaturase)
MVGIALTASNKRPWRKILAAYRNPSLARSVGEIAITAAPLALLWIAGCFAVSFGHWWLALLLTLPAAAFLVRLFMVQHDCGHRSFFKSARLNDWIGRILGVLTLTPYDCWRRTHAIHHATSGDLDRRGLGAVPTLTVEEYRALSPARRLVYRLCRHPLVLLGFGPIYVFFLQQRLPLGLMREGWRPWVSALGTNAAIAGLLGVAIALGGAKALLLVYLPTLLLAAAIGVWLFYVQHQFEHTYWVRHDDWDPTEAALRGSSHYVLPPPLRWITANIGVHHVHHASSSIPFYRLRTVLRDFPELAAMGRLTIPESIGCVRLSLWDEERKQLVSFKQFDRADAPPRPPVAAPAA